MEFTPILKNFTSVFHSPLHSPKNKIPHVIFILSPHPDDECIIGSLALRLMLENQAEIINLAVTLGSNKERQEERKSELENACRTLGIKNYFLDESWSKKAKELKSLIQKYRPSLIIAPHLKDHHPTHIRTSELLKSALLTTKGVNTIIAWSEFWGQLSSPNILLEVPLDILELQMRALAQHAGEVKRNPYHLRLPAWMMDNVRRGSELVSGKGANAPLMAFGVLYQIQLFHRGKFTKIKLENSILDHRSDLGQIFKLILEAAAGSKTKVN